MSLQEILTTIDIALNSLEIYADLFKHGLWSAVYCVLRFKNYDKTLLEKKREKGDVIGTVSNH